MTAVDAKGDGSRRVIAQFLEGGAGSAAMSPASAAACLRDACSLLPITDVCLGWRLPEPLIDAVMEEAMRSGCSVWLWHPLLSGDGQFVPREDAAVGPARTPLPWPKGMSEFAFDCPVRAHGIEAALERLRVAADRAAWSGVFLDKIRWPSPTRDPASDLACFCDACRTSCSGFDIDIDAVAQFLASAATTADGREEVVANLLGVDRSGVLARYLDWRCAMITKAVEVAAATVAALPTSNRPPMRLALDIFTPSLGRTVGQDAAALAPLGEFTKTMSYLGTFGPAGMSYELGRLARWLEAGDVTDPVARLSEMLGYPLASGAASGIGVLGPQVFASEIQRLREDVGQGSAVGIDAVELPDIAVLDDGALVDAVAIAASSRVGMVLSWDLRFISPKRQQLIAGALDEAWSSGLAS